MSLLDEAQAAQARKGPDCTVSTARKALGADLDELLEAVRAGHVYATTAAKVLQAHDQSVKDEAIRRHLKAECSCP